MIFLVKERSARSLIQHALRNIDLTNLYLFPKLDAPFLAPFFYLFTSALFRKPSLWELKLMPGAQLGVYRIEVDGRGEKILYRQAAVVSAAQKADLIIQNSTCS